MASKLKPAPDFNSCQIVISGISGKFPESDSICEFAEHLFNGVDLVTEDDSSQRWSRGLFGLPTRTGKLKRLDQFDATAFGLNESQANVMDPMLRILLELTFEAVYDAGINPSTLRGSRTGVFVGAAKSESSELLLSDPDSVNDFNLVGNSRGMFANAISYFYDFHGPSLTTETACSSSLQALERAVAAIRIGQCDSAIVGGANLLLKPQASLEFHKLNMLSTDGKCKAFDKSANGYVRSEAVVVIYIQKSSVALAHKSYTTILNIKSNSDGYKEQGITYPSGSMQLRLLQEVYSEIGVDPRQVVYVEAHGTGTAIGDPQEANSIAEHFRPTGANSDRSGPLLIGSVKSNMGHAEHASGLCALAKVIVAIVYGKIPANLHFREPNPNIPSLVDGRLKVVASVCDLPSTGIIGVNSFGFGGSNVHLILKPSTYNGLKSPNKMSELPLLVPFSGRTTTSATETLESLKQCVGQDLDMRLGCATRAAAVAALHHKIHHDDIDIHDYRGFLVSSTESGSFEEAFVQEKSLTLKTEEQPQIWFVFSGMGSQWTGMGNALLKFEPFKASIQECCRILKPYDIDLWEILTRDCESALESTLDSFVAIAAVQIALVDFLNAIGISSVDGIIGHSIGENVCAYVDGHATKEQTLLVPYWAGLIFQRELSSLNPGTMATVGLSWEEAKARCPASVYLACHNAPDNVSVSGTVADVQAFVESLKSEGVFAREIKAGQAFHSPYISIMQEKLDQTLLNNRALPPNCKRERSSKWISTSYPEDEWNSEEAKYISSAYFAHNLVSPVLFKEALEKIPPNSIVLEIGPHCLLQPILKRSLSKVNATVLGISNKNAADNAVHILSTIGKLWTSTRHLKMNWASLYKCTTAIPVLLSPLVSWDHTNSFRVVNFELDSKTARLNSVKISLQESPFLRDYKIGSQIVFPGTGFLVLVWKHLARNREVECDHERLAITFEDVHFHEPVLLSEEDEKSVTQFTINVLEGNGKFEVIHFTQVVCSGRAKLSESNELQQPQPHNGENGCLPSLKNTGHDNVARVHWSWNWIAYLESVVQIALPSHFQQQLKLDPGNRKASGIPLLSCLEYACIDPGQLAKGQDAATAISRELSACKKNRQAVTAPGVELRGVRFKIDSGQGSGSQYVKSLRTTTALDSYVANLAQNILPFPFESGNSQLQCRQCQVQYALVDFDHKLCSEPALKSFAGINSVGERVMGASLSSDAELVWKVPDGWRLQDAAAVPFAYTIAFYALQIKAELRAGESVLIPSGMSDIGQASIAIAIAVAHGLGRGAEIFVTVKSCQEEKALTSMYPELNEEQIFVTNAKGLGFAHQVLEATNGCGVDVVMNLGDVSLQESISCLRQHGRFLHTQDSNADNGNVSLGLACFLNNITFYGININHSSLQTCNSTLEERIFELLSNGIQSGVVRPIQNLNVIELEEIDTLKFPDFKAKSYSGLSGRGRVLIKFTQAERK